MYIKKIIRSIDKKELKFLLITTLVTIIIVFIPLIYGYINTPNGSDYNGMYGPALCDKHVYYSYIEQVKQGHFLFKDLYSSEPQNRILLNVFWLSAGIFGKILKISNALTFYLYKIPLIPILIIISYLFIALVFRDKIKRKITLIFLLFGSGLGGIAAIFIQAIYKDTTNVWPMDLWSSGLSTFSIFYNSPHLIASFFLIVFTFLLAFLAIEHNRIKYSIFAGLSGLLLFQFHPFHVPTIFCVLVVYSLIHPLKNKSTHLSKDGVVKKILSHNLKHILIILLISSPSIIYHLVLLKYDWLTIQRAIQNITLTPNLWVTIISYGFLFIGAILGSLTLLKRKNKLKNIHIFLIVWFMVQFFLLYFPIHFQRHFNVGLNIPMVMLTTIFIFYLHKKCKNNIKNKFLNFIIINNKATLFFLFILIFSLSNIRNISRDIIDFSTDNINVREIFYPSSEKINAMKWLKYNTKENDIILSEYNNSNMIPGISGKTVFLGHHIETALSQKKNKYVKWFFSTQENSDKHYEFLIKNKITHIFYGESEKKLGNWNPDKEYYLEKIFENQNTKIYKVL